MKQQTETPLVRSIGWLGMATGVIGAAVTSLVPLIGAGWLGLAFSAWLISNAAWLLHSQCIRVWSQWTMQLVYLAISLVGLTTNFGWGVGSGAGLVALFYLRNLERIGAFVLKEGPRPAPD